MTDLVIGGGPVGTLMAWALASDGREVALVRRRHEGPPASTEVTAIDHVGKRSTVRVTEIRSPSDLVAAPEVIVFAVKMFDLEGATASCAVWPDAVGFTVSNGIGAEEIVAEARPGAGLIAGSVTASVELEADGVVQRLNSGGIGLAVARGDMEHLMYDLAEAFDVSGLPSDTYSYFEAMKWSKLIANLVANSTSAIVDLPPAAIYDDPAGFRIERRQLQEAFAVVRWLGLVPVALPGANIPLLRLGIRLPSLLARRILRRVVAGARGGKDPSLRLHAQASAGESEVAWLNGAVARTAEQLHESAPVNRRLVELVEEVVRDPVRREWFRGRIDRLVEAVEAGDAAAAARSRA